MASLSFKNRIAIYNLAGAATLVLVAFVLIYHIVSAAVNYDINEDLQIEIDSHTGFVANQQPFQRYTAINEWKESEHTGIVINPVFVQIFDKNGRSIEKSPNLKGADLKWNVDKDDKYADTYVSGIAIRQQMAKLVNNGEIKGYVIIAMSVELPNRVLDNLLWVLCITYPVMLLVLFVITRVIAGKSIAPAINIISTTKKITENNFGKRITLPVNRDELYTLSTTINELLDRIENAITREKQFASDASHELRTPLAVIRGTLEVLVRKPRDTAEYEEKINYCIVEVNRLTTIVEQLLLMARFESNKAALQLNSTALDEIILQAMERYSPEIKLKNISVNFRFNDHFYVITDAAMTAIIIENLLSNAIKYSYDGGHIDINLLQNDSGVICTIGDNGRGIAKEDIDKVYEQFYRSEATEHTAIKGTGLGLSIVKRLCDMLGVTIALDSKKGSGTTVTLTFRSGN